MMGLTTQSAESSEFSEDSVYEVVTVELTDLDETEIVDSGEDQVGLF